MSARLLRPRDRARGSLPWLLLGLGLVLATEPAWGPAVFGTRLGIEDLLLLRCGPP